MVVSGQCFFCSLVFFRCILSGLQGSVMVPTITLATWIQLLGSFMHPHDNQFPQKVFSQVMQVTMQLSTVLSLSFFGILYRMVSGLSTQWGLPGETPYSFTLVFVDWLLEFFFEHIKYQHISRNKNTITDAFANYILDWHLSHTL